LFETELDLLMINKGKINKVKRVKKILNMERLYCYLYWNYSKLFKVEDEIEAITIDEEATSFS